MIEGQVLLMSTYSVGRVLTSSHLLTALLDLPAADGSERDEQTQQTHGQTDRHPQSHRRKHQILAYRQRGRQTVSERDTHRETH